MENKHNENKPEESANNFKESSSNNQSSSTPVKHKTAYNKKTPYTKKPYGNSGYQKWNNKSSYNKNESNKSYSDNNSNKYEDSNKENKQDKNNLSETKTNRYPNKRYENSSLNNNHSNPQTNNRSNSYSSSHSNNQNNNRYNNNQYNQNKEEFVYGEEVIYNKNNDYENELSEQEEFEKNAQSAQKQTEELAFDFDNDADLMNVNKSPIMQDTQNSVSPNPSLETEDDVHPQDEDELPFNIDNNQSLEQTTVSPTQPINENSCVETSDSTQLLFGKATQEQFISMAKTHLLLLNDKGDINVPMKSYQHSIFEKECLIVPDINPKHLGYGNIHLPFNQLKSILESNGIFVAERIGKFSAIKQNWVLYEDIGIKPLTDISVNGKYSDTVIIQIAEMAASIHSISTGKSSSFINTVEGFMFLYQKYLNGYADGISKEIGSVYSLFRFPKEKSDWMKVPNNLPYSKNLCLCAINYSPNNIFLTNTGSTIIANWDTAGPAPASYDLANIIHALKLNTHQEKLLLKSYTDFFNIKDKKFKKEVELFKSVFITKEAVDLLSGTYNSVKQELLKSKDAEAAAEILYEVIKSAYKVWNFPDEKILAKESMYAAVNKWIRNKGPGKAEWIPETESLDEWLTSHMSLYRGDSFLL